MPRAPFTYPPRFEQTWAHYPLRSGSNSKRKAFTAWAARLREGVSPDEIDEGLARYDAFCAVTKKLGTELVMLAARFFGPGEEWRATWDTGAPTAAVMPPLSSAASSDELALRRDATALYETLRSLEVARFDLHRAQGAFKAACDRGTIARPLGLAVYFAMYGRDGQQPTDGGALRKALQDGRPRDAVPTLESVLRGASAAQSEAA